MSRKKISPQPMDKSVDVAKIGIIVSLVTVIGVIATAFFNYLSTRTQIELPIRATQTAEARNVLPTTSVLFNATPTVPIQLTDPMLTLSPTAPPIYGPISGELIHDSTSPRSSQNAGVRLRDFIVDVRLYTPSNGKGQWSYGVGFRQDRSEGYRLILLSGSTYTLRVSDIAYGGDAIELPVVFEASLPNMDTSPYGSNLIRLIVENGKFSFILNDTLIISDLTLTERNVPGDIYIFSELDSDYVYFDKPITLYDRFTIWSLP